MNLLKRYKAPTPHKWKQIGDALLIIGSTITTYAIFEHNELFALISLICTVLGKLIPNFITDETINTPDSIDNSISDTSDTCKCTDCQCGKEIEPEDLRISKEHFEAGRDDQGDKD